MPFNALVVKASKILLNSVMCLKIVFTCQIIHLHNYKASIKILSDLDFLNCMSLSSLAQLPQHKCPLSCFKCDSLWMWNLISCNNMVYNPAQRLSQKNVSVPFLQSFYTSEVMTFYFQQMFRFLHDTIYSHFNLFLYPVFSCARLVFVWFSWVWMMEMPSIL